MSAQLTAMQMELQALIEEEIRAARTNKLFFYFPDQDTYLPGGKTVAYHARHKYHKHLEFFRAGAAYQERCAMCANRVGKSESMGGYETVMHLTGLYPDWWEGRRFERPTKGWAAGKTNETTRDIIQAKLFGSVTRATGRKGVDGTGLVPADRIGEVTWKQGVSDLLDTIKVQHISGDWSILGLKSYQQGRGSFEGTEQDFIWLDEEPPMDVYGECLIRTATTNGIIYITFTPLEGVSEVVRQFLPGKIVGTVGEVADA